MNGYERAGVLNYEVRSGPARDRFLWAVLWQECLQRSAGGGPFWAAGWTAEPDSPMRILATKTHVRTRPAFV